MMRYDIVWDLEFVCWLTRTVEGRGGDLLEGEGGVDRSSIIGNLTLPNAHRMVFCANIMSQN